MFRMGRDSACRLFYIYRLSCHRNVSLHFKNVVIKEHEMMNCPALIYSTDSPLLPVPFTIYLDNDKLEVNEAGELDTSKFFKDIYKEHVYVDDGATVVIRRDEQSDFVVSATYGSKMSGKVVMVVNLPEGIAPSDIGLVYDE